MKKAIWILSFIPMIITVIVYDMLPEKIPMHYDISGNIDRWGSRAEQFIFPCVILFLALLWYIFEICYEKKIASGKCTEKQIAEYTNNLKVLGYIGIFQAIMYTLLHCVFLYTAYESAVNDSNEATVDINKVTCILLGIFFIVIGDIMPKAKMNGVFGVRTTWSMYNDNTWRKSNRFGAAIMTIIGVLSIVTAVFLNGMLSMFIMLGYLFFAVIAIVIYSRKVYDKENDLG